MARVCSEWGQALPVLMHSRSPSPFLAPGRARGRSPTRKELLVTCGTTLGTARIGQALPARIGQTVPATIGQALPAKIGQTVPATIGQALPAIVSSRRTPANEDSGEDPALQERSLSLQGDAPPAMPLGIETCSGHEAATKSMLPLEAPRASQEKPGQGEAKQFFFAEV